MKRRKVVFHHEIGFGYLDMFTPFSLTQNNEIDTYIFIAKDTPLPYTSINKTIKWMRFFTYQNGAEKTTAYATHHWLLNYIYFRSVFNFQ